MPEKIDSKYLKGLRFRSSDPVKGRSEDGQETIKHIPNERALKIEDVLDWKDCGTEVVIVAADGQKHRVAKKEDKKNDDDSKKNDQK